MRYGVQYAPRVSPSPSPTLNITSDGNIPNNNPTMIVSVILALFLPCAGMSLVFIVYLSLLWCASNDNDNNGDVRLPVKAVAEGGLSASELDKLPKISGKELVMGTECAVCLDEVEREQPARLVPGCNHSFHIQCADSWLSKHSVCPVCRAKLDSHFFNALDSCNPC